ncbi:MAG: hypothetical protein WBC47_09365, partial [Dehalococcoidia bacterium]
MLTKRGFIYGLIRRITVAFALSLSKGACRREPVKGPFMVRQACTERSRRAHHERVVVSLLV